MSLNQVWSPPEDYDGWYCPLATIEDQDPRSSLNALEYRHVDESEPDGDAAVQLLSGRFVFVREYSNTGRPGAYNLSRVGRATDPVSVLAEFLAEAGIDESKVLWTEFDGRRKYSSWGT